MRPNVSDEIGEDLDKVVGQISSVDLDSVGFEQKIRILFGNLGDIELRKSKTEYSPAGEVKNKYS